MDLAQELAHFAPAKETLVTIGVFDGVHLGHRALFQRLKEAAEERDLLPCVITFRNHPLSILKPEVTVPCLSSLEDRIGRMRALGITTVVPLTFSLELSQVTAAQFAKTLQESIKMRGIVVGPDFALGKDREGTEPFLRRLGIEQGFSVETVKPFFVNGTMISSTLIRTLVAQGQVEKARHFLGNAFALKGSVVSGARRGRRLGFPTANLSLDQRFAMPGFGVYATRAWLGSRAYHSATNVGLRPTFADTSSPVVEAYLMDFQGDLYGETLRLEFIQRLRDEAHFATPGQLIQQMALDIQQAEQILRRYESSHDN